MAIKTPFQLLFTLFVLGLAPTLRAQQLLIVNGGLFGSSTEHANLGLYNSLTQSFQVIDTIHTNSVQDILVENDRYAYVAAQDSIVKYDLYSGTRVAAAAFGAASTIRLGIYGNKLLVGNWYGASNGNLRIFDKNDLSFQDSIPEITKGATDFVIIGNRAYIAQNNSNSNYADTLGYLAIVDLTNNSFVQFDTLSTVGDEIGRLVNVGDSAIYSINGISNSISSYHIASAVGHTVAAAATLNPRSTGGSIYFDGNKWYLPFGNGIGSYDLVNNSVISANLISIGAQWQSFAFAVDTAQSEIYVSYIDYANQAANLGIRYNNTGDSLGLFPVGFSPEVLGIWNSNVTLSVPNIQNDLATLEFTIFPNPASHYLQIQSEAYLQSLQISSFDGRIIDHIELSAQTANLHIEQLPAGSYLLSAWSSDGKRLSKVFIKK